MGTYTIALNNCAFFARHGVLAEEMALGQRFFVDLTMTVEADDALDSDEVSQTVHYGEAYALVADIVTNTRRNLIETLAKDIGKALCAWSGQIRRVEIAIRKPSVPIEGILDYAEVRVEHVA
jgi:7,8-dihydroneopterin aldolase/epimerase/oxygenase